MRPKGLLSLNVDLINHPAEENSGSGNNNIAESSRCFQLGDTTFRSEGISIGQDYLRLEGKTVTRGELVHESLILKEVIGRGAFSTVQRAIWKNTKNEQNTNVAVKTFSLLDSSKQRRDMLLKELRTLCKVGSPSLVHLHGAFLQPETDLVTLVLEHMDRGSLHEYIISKKSSSKEEGELNALSSSPAPLAAVAYQMLLGLAYLHQDHLRIIHRDLKSPNVLLHSTGAVKLCDFGLAALGNPVYDSSSLAISDDHLNTTVLGTTKFMAPERLCGLPYGRSSDLWSFGLVLLECVTGTPPWMNVTSVVDLLVTVQETDMQDLIPTNCHAVEDELREVMVACFQKDAAKRIPAKVLLQSPWFQVHDIRNLESAMERTKDLYI